MSVLTTFRVTNKEVTELAFEKALIIGAFTRPYYVLTQPMRDHLRDLGDDLLLAFSYPSMNTMEMTARKNMMASIGTSILLLEEVLLIENVGLVHHTMGINRLGTELMWQPIDVYWLEGERCPFQIKN